jgi:hypothetical protein
MIDAKTQKEIAKVTFEMWQEKARTDQVFRGLTKGKERGHRMADFVDERTTALLETHFTTKFQTGARGAASRSMGDVWLQSCGIFNPINVKTGVAGANGQPNLVSLKKLLRVLLADRIDSYYLLFVKFDLSTEPEPRVYLVDLLEHLDFATYDDGPGQMMLREQEFFTAMEGGGRAATGLTMIEKIDRLFALLKDGNRRLIQNRERTIGNFEKSIAEYRRRPKHVINQSGWGLGDE